MHVSEAQGATLAQLSPDEVPVLMEHVITLLESPSSDPSPPSDSSLAVLAVLLAAARAPSADTALLRAALQAAAVPAAVLDALLSAAAAGRERVQRALLAGQRRPAQLVSVSWRLAAVVGSRALPAQLQPELLLRLRLTGAGGGAAAAEDSELTLLAEPADLRHVTAELERALSRRPAAHRYRAGTGGHA